MSLKKFTTAAREVVEQPPATITISTLGKIMFSKSASSMYDFSKLEYAVLYFDDVKNVVEIAFSQKEEDGAMKMLHSESNGYHINAKSFLKWAKIPFLRSANFPMSEKENRFSFTVKKGQLKKIPPKKSVKGIKGK